MNVRQATIDSVNVIFAQLDLDVGPENVEQMAYEARDHHARSTASRPRGSAACGSG